VVVRGVREGEVRNNRIGGWAGGGAVYSNAGGVEGAPGTGRRARLRL